MLLEGTTHRLYDNPNGSSNEERYYMLILFGFGIG